MAYAQAFLQLVKMGTDANKEAKLKHEADALNKTRPTIGRDPMADQNLSLVKSELANGMSAGAEQAYNDIADRQFSSGLGAILKGGGDINTVGNLYGSAQDGQLKLAMMRDSMRLNQVQNVLNQSKYVDERNVVTPFEVNLDSPWKDKAQAVSVARGQAAKATNDDSNTFLSSLMRIGQDNSLKSNSGTSVTTSNSPVFNMGTDATTTAGDGLFDSGAEFNNIA